VKLLGRLSRHAAGAVRVVIGLDEALPASNLQNFVLIGGGLPAWAEEVMGSRP